MNAMDLLLGLNDVEDAYIIRAEEFRHRKRSTQVSRFPARRAWLIAAIIALTLLLVGCAVAYILRMQDLKVGEYHFYVPPAYDENGEVIPVESREPVTLLSVQGTNMEALAQWVAFTNAYDRDGTIALGADRAAMAGAPWDIPEKYRLYGCYSQEMVDELNQIVERYRLKLLSGAVSLNYYENSVLFRALSLGQLVYDAPNVQTAYWDGDFYLEGTFSLNMMITADFGDWKWEESNVHYHYSLKDYFDPSTGSMMESQAYTQWDYTRRDGKKVLLVLGEDSARIYADLSDAFVSIGMEPVILTDHGEASMTRAALQQLAELFDLAIKPQPATMAQVEKYRAEAGAQYDAERAASRAEREAAREAAYTAGYSEFVDYLLQNTYMPEKLSYILYDLNGDGVLELITKGAKILSMKDGTSYRYFDPEDSVWIGGTFVLCENNVFEVYSEVPEISPFNQYNFYQANAQSADFLIGVCHDTQADKWYRSLDGGTENIQPISEEEAGSILSIHPQREIRWLPLIKFGQPDTGISYSDPYAAYIADILERYSNAESNTYALMDLNGDGIQELITAQPDDSKMRIFTIRDGAIKQYASGISYICQGNILEECEENTDSGRFYAWYRCGADGPEYIEKVVRDPYTLYWGYARAGQEGKTVRTEEAQTVIDSYQHIRLDMKPFSEYPFG